MSKANPAKTVILALLVLLAKMDLKDFKESKENKALLEALAVLVNKD